MSKEEKMKRIKQRIPKTRNYKAKMKKLYHNNDAVNTFFDRLIEFKIAIKNNDQYKLNQIYEKYTE